jgi:hypothetical protein
MIKEVKPGYFLVVIRLTSGGKNEPAFALETRHNRARENETNAFFILSVRTSFDV